MHSITHALIPTYVPTFTVNLIPGVLVCRNGATLEATGSTLRILQNCRTVLSADSANGLFAVRGVVNA